MVRQIGMSRIIITEYCILHNMRFLCGCCGCGCGLFLPLLAHAVVPVLSEQEHWAEPPTAPGPWSTVRERPTSANFAADNTIDNCTVGCKIGFPFTNSLLISAPQMPLKTTFFDALGFGGYPAK